MKDTWKNTWHSMKAEEAKRLEEAVIEVMEENGLEYEATSLTKGELASSVTVRTGIVEGYYVDVNQYESTVSIRTHNYENAKKLVTVMIMSFMPCNW